MRKKTCETHTYIYIYVNKEKLKNVRFSSWSTTSSKKSIFVNSFASTLFFTYISEFTLFKKKVL